MKDKSKAPRFIKRDGREGRYKKDGLSIETTVSAAVLERYIADYTPLVFSVCCSMLGDPFTAEDLAQETFLAAFTHLNSFDGTNPKAWLTRIATNKCLDYLKSAQRRAAPTEDEALAAFADPGGSPESLTLDRLLYERLAQLCAALHPPYREVAYAHFVEERSAAEIAQSSGQKRKTVETQIFRARKMLQALWKGETP